MAALIYQPDCGIAGDMHMAALIDLGVPVDWLKPELEKLAVHGEFTLTISAAQSKGISGTQVRVACAESHHHRHYTDITRMIEAAGYPDDVTQAAQHIFYLIADAEARIHNIDIEDVHFHEVGALDAIVDIAGAALCLHYLRTRHGVTEIYSTPVELGSGEVQCAHGRYPVPAPATLRIMQQVPTRLAGVSGECTTPTGAAILKHAVTHWDTPAIVIPNGIGYGIGFKSFEKPNALRVVLADTQIKADAPAAESLTHVKLEANIDDMSPEAFEPLMKALLTLGAQDVFLTSISMKKSRPGVCLGVLAPAELENRLADHILNNTTTIGLRVLPFRKRELPRQSLQITTRHGAVLVKQVVQPDGLSRWKVEHDDIARIAEDLKQGYLATRTQIEADVRDYLSRQPAPAADQ